MKRGPKKKFKLRIKPDTVRSILALLLVGAGIIGLISFIAPSYTINSRIRAFLMELFGLPSIIMPFLLIISGTLFIQNLKIKIKEPRIVIGLVLALLSVSGLFHSFIDSGEAESVAEEGLGGGIVGYKISTILSSGISIYGAVVLLFLLFIVSLLLISDVSLDCALGFVAEKAQRIKLPFRLPGFIGKRSTDGDDNLDEATSEDDTDSEEAGVRNADLDLGSSQDEEDEQPFEIIPSQAEPQTAPAIYNPNQTSSIAPAVPMNFLSPPPNKIWIEPPIDLLNEPVAEQKDSTESKQNEKKIVETLRSFGIDVEIASTKIGPSVTQYALRTKSVTKVSKIASLHEDLAMALASPTGSVRVEAPIPGTSEIGIEVPNKNRTLVYFKSILTSDPMKNIKSKLGIALGKDVSGRTHVYDISKMPHLLIAGATGSGKSIFIHNILFSILYRATPQEVKFVLVDPKRIELIYYQDIPHLLTPVVVDMDKASSVFRWAVQEMERRYKLFEQARARNIEAYNESSGFQALPYIVIIVDEFAEIMLRDTNEVERSVVRLAQLARATGIHLVLAVQRPSINVITGTIKANIPTRVAFNVASQIDSRVIIDQPGAEKLLGKGDMLFVPPDAQKPVRLQGAFISDKEISNLVGYLKGQGVGPDYTEEVLSMSPDKDNKSSSAAWGDGVDSLFDEAVDIVSSTGRASASLLQRKLSIGFARASRIIDEMEDKGIIGPSVGGSKAREVLIGGSSGPFNDIDDLVS